MQAGRLAAAGCAAAALICGPCGPAQAAEPIFLEVATLEVCRAVQGVTAVEPGSRFSVDVGAVYCLSRIGNVTRAAKVQHVWYAGAEERLRVVMAVKPPSWRIYSMKRIRPQDLGSWRVEITDLESNVLKTIFFEITP